MEQHEPRRHRCLRQRVLRLAVVALVGAIASSCLDEPLDSEAPELESADAFRSDSACHLYWDNDGDGAPDAISTMEDIRTERQCEDECAAAACDAYCVGSILDCDAQAFGGVGPEAF